MKAVRDGESNLWRMPGLPHKGWGCVDVEDHEEPSFTCQACGFSEVRYVHVMTHPDVSGEVRVGCVCAGHLEGDHAAAKGRDRAVRNAANRRARARKSWVEPKRWKRSRKGGFYRKTGGVLVIIFPDAHKPGAWKAKIGETFGTRWYASAEDAMRGVFDRAYSLKQGTAAIS